ncbi:DUF5696 domain-containing protein [Paenibacillus thailandensis]|uniref:DUF5696 domain-containing protein n=1 Tax=Paenibacillus thailandensis TaxID=393250 RepID=A0ABW5R3I5_9BACL
MNWIWRHKKAAVYALVAFGILLLVSQAKITFKQDSAYAEMPSGQERQGGSKSKALPDESNFKLIQENDTLRLKFDESSGHFIVEDKRSGNVWRSYPNPDDWDNPGIAGSWIEHMQSPVMLQHIDFYNPNAKPKETNFAKEQGTVVKAAPTENGIEFVLELPTLGFQIPVRLSLHDDYVETAIIDEGIQETGTESLLWLRLYPFFSAEQSGNEEGYLFIPDGSGALISFQKQESAIKQLYQERIYGSDASFINNPSSRYNISMPVYGMKIGKKAFLAVVSGGAGYSDIVASPAGVYGNYNWIGTQQHYRMKFMQITNRAKNNGFETYTKDSRFGDDRVTRYYFLNEDAADYVGMASRYRQYLMQEQGLKRISPRDSNIPLFLSILGADRHNGVLTDRYVKATTFPEAMQMVQELYGLGIMNMDITLYGWQENGYSSLGGYLPVDRRIGGESGLKNFIEFAHSLEIPVSLEVNYELNNSGMNGFVGRYHGVRDLAGSLMSFTANSGDQITAASRKFIEKAVRDDMVRFKKLGIDGLLMEGIGRYVNTDYNTKYGGTRSEVVQSDLNILGEVKEAVGSVRVNNAGFYAIGRSDHVDRLIDDHSYDLFSTGPIPFAQIALHGLKTYTSLPENARSQYQIEFLRDIEYGSYPSFDFTMAETSELTGAYWYTPRSSAFDDWKMEAVEQYQQYNEIFGELQDQFIVGHRRLDAGVYETVYENGTKVYVNYNREDYDRDGIRVSAMDYAVAKGGRDR